MLRLCDIRRSAIDDSAVGTAGTAGEQLGTGWRPALRLLEAVPQDPEVDSEAVGLAFQSVQLLSSDYMAALPLDLLRTSLEVAAIFGSQQVGGPSR